MKTLCFLVSFLFSLVGLAQPFTFHDTAFVGTLTQAAAAPAGGLTTSLTAVWEMEAADATDQPDATGNGYTLTRSGATVQSTTKIQGSYSVDTGGSAHLSTSDTKFETEGSFSIAIWFNTKSENIDGKALVSRWGDGGKCWLLAGAGNVLTLYIRNAADGGNFSAASTINVYDDSDWHLVVITYTSSTLTGRISVDNEAQVSTGATDGLRDVGVNLTFMDYESGTDAYTGLTDEVAYWDNRVLSTDDISEIWASGSGKFYPAW